MHAVKISSSDFLNLPLIIGAAALNLPMLFSTGMSTHAEIFEMLSQIKDYVIDFALLHCNSTYPAPFFDINLAYMDSLRELHPIVGYSGHERGIEICLAARARGAMLIERHLTFDKEADGPDHAASLTPLEFSQLTCSIKNIDDALGTTGSRKISQGERLNRQILGKSIVAKSDLPREHLIQRDDLEFKCPGNGFSPNQLELVVGERLQASVRKGRSFKKIILNPSP